MKKFLIPITITLFATGAMFTGCESSAQKVENAEQGVADAQVKLDQARIDSVAEYEKTKLEWSNQITANEKAISDYRAKIATEKKEQREKDEARLDALETRNAAMKVQMNEYKQDAQSNWAEFKTNWKKMSDDFSEDMSEFGKSIEKMTDTNKK